MAASRTYLLQINLDELNAFTSSLWTDSDRAAALIGLGLGCNAGQCPSDAPPSLRRAWEISIVWRDRTEAFRRSKKKGGVESAKARKTKNGTAQPSRTTESSPDPEHMLVECSDDVPECFELTSNQ